MTRCARASVGAAAAIVTVILASPSFAGQAPAAARRSAAWTPPRTAWGDPDLQGNFTNLYEVGTPFERPDEFAGRRLEDVKGDELASIRRDIQGRTREEELSGEIGGTRWIWLDSLDHAKGSMAWFVVDPPDGRIPPTTAEAQKRLAARAAARQASGRGPADSYEDRSLFDRCITRGLPGSMMPVVYGNSYQIVQGPGFVAIRYEMIHETRVIPLDDRPMPPSQFKGYMGYSRGHFEGNTLVVRTTNLNGKTGAQGNGSMLINSDAAVLTERFTPIGKDALQYEVTVDDPKTWTQPWKVSFPLKRESDYGFYEYACHEGNYAMRNTLSGSRADEKR